MSNREHLDVFLQGVEVWNQWRMENPDVKPDLEGVNARNANLPGIDLIEANMVRANLSGANLFRSYLSRAVLAQTNFSGANLSSSDLFGANLLQANLSKTNLLGANLIQANFKKAKLNEADLRYAQLIETNFEEASISGCRIQWVSAWGVNLKGAIQKDLIVTHPNEPTVTVDNLNVGQLAQLMIHDKNMDDVIDSISTRLVLILCRVTPERKGILDRTKEVIRKKEYVPVVFNFDKPGSKNVSETISPLARMARFIIADVAEPDSVPQEFFSLVPDLPSVPVQVIMERSLIKEYSLLQELVKHDWVLKIQRYDDPNDLVQSLQETIIDPLEKKVEELKKKRNGKQE